MGPVEGTTTVMDNQLDAADLWADAVPLPVPAGSAIVFSSLTPHRSARNRSAADRRALLFTFNPKRLGECYDKKLPSDGGGTKLRDLSRQYVRAKRTGDHAALAPARQGVESISHRED